MAIRNKGLIFPELSYQIVGASIDVFREMGPGHRELYYQRALAEAFRLRGIPFREQVQTPLRFAGKNVGSSRFDFVADQKIVVEIKALQRFRQEHYRQVKHYLVQSGLPLGMLIRFSDDGAICERILRPSAVS